MSIAPYAIVPLPPISQGAIYQHHFWWLLSELRSIRANLRCQLTCFIATRTSRTEANGERRVSLVITVSRHWYVVNNPLTLIRTGKSVSREFNSIRTTKINEVLIVAQHSELESIYNQHKHSTLIHWLNLKLIKIHWTHDVSHKFSIRYIDHRERRVMSGWLRSQLSPSHFRK